MKVLRGLTATIGNKGSQRARLVSERWGREKPGATPAGGGGRGSTHQNLIPRQAWRRWTPLAPGFDPGGAKKSLTLLPPPFIHGSPLVLRQAFPLMDFRSGNDSRPGQARRGSPPATPPPSAPRGVRLDKKEYGPIELCRNSIDSYQGGAQILWNSLVPHLLSWNRGRQSVS